jgi:protein TonB
MTFEDFLTHDKRNPKRGRRLTFIISLAAHGVLLALGVAHSFAQVEELSPPSVPLVFLQAPPPPPPLLGGGRRTPPKVTTPRPKVAQPELQQPSKDPPKETETPKTDGPVGPGNDPNGSKTGIIGSKGITEIVEPPPTLVPPSVARGQLAIDPQAEPYRVKLPGALATSGMQLWALVKLCATRDGQVESATIVRPADPMLDPIIAETLRRWRYHPYTVNGRPVPFCTMVRYEITTR